MMSHERSQIALNRRARHTAAAVMVIAVCLVCMPLLSGCGRSLGAGVSGTVTVDGKPLPKGTVVFHPVAGGATVYAEIGTGGAYRLQTGANKSLAPGDYIVTVAAFSRPLEPGMSQEQIEAARLSPIKYGSKETSGLKFTVVPGSNRIDIAMQNN